jgi:hypothetical protein
MSYSGYPNHSSYYGAPQSDSTRQNGYVPTRSNVPTSSSYPDPVAYSAETRDYPWLTPNQQSYSANSTTQGQYAADPYRDSTNGHTYDYQRAHASRVGSTKKQAEIQAYSNNGSHTQKQTSTQALNELVYASGLESSGLQNAAPARNVQEPQRNNTPQNAVLTQSQTESSATHIQQTNDGQTQPNPYHAQNAYQSSDQQNHLAMSAAAALQNLPNSSTSKLASPVISAAQATPAPSQQRPQSPYVTSQSTVSHQRNPSSQIRTKQQAMNTSRTAATSTSKPAADSTQSRQSYSVTPTETRQAPPQQTNNVADLVTNDNRQESPTYLARDEIASPTFVAPFEIFNPYHKQQETARREAAAAEAAAKRKAVEDALKAKNAPPPAPDTQAQSDYAVSIPPPDVSKPKSKAAGKSKSSSPGPTGDTDIETEFRRLMARMREIQAKDPATAKKVWDEQRAPVPTASTTSSAPDMPSQQKLPPSTQMATPKNKSSTSSVQEEPQPDIPRGFNGYRVIVEDNEDGFPDLGKFPAERRIRYSYSRKPQPSPASTPQSIVPPDPVPPVNATPQAGALVFNPHAASETVAVSQPLPQNGKDGKTVWPEAQRKALADAAVGFLKSDPRNQSLTITDTDFIKILDSNPTYVDLCLLIEARGFKFDRRHFAKTLMNRVPNLGPNPQVPVAVVPSQGQAARGYVPAAPPIFNPPTAKTPFTNRSSSPFLKPETPFQRFTNTTPLMDQRNSPLVPHSRSRVATPAPQIPAPMPSSKEENARKRDFNDLVDLTNDDDEDYIVTEKRQRIRSPSPDPIASFVQQSRLPSQSESSFARFGGPILPNNATPLKFDTHATDSLPEPPKQPQFSKMILAKKVNKAEALRRNYYDPKTVARDILITIGKHPSQTRLNSHMAHLLGTHIELESDLSTFNWEDIDPGGPPAPKTPWTDIPAGPPRFKARKSEQSRSTDARSKALQNAAVSAAPLPRSTPDFTNGVSSNGHVTTNKYMGRFGSGNFMRAKVYEGQLPKKRKGAVPSPLNSNPRRDFSPQAAHRAEESLRRLAQQTKSLFIDSFKPPERRPSGLRQSQTTVSEDDAPTSQVLTPPKKRGPGRLRRDSKITASSAAPSTEPQRRGAGRTPRSISSPQVLTSPVQPALAAPSSQRSESAETSKMESKRRGRPLGSKNKPHHTESKSGTSLEVIVPRRRAENDAPEFPVFKCAWIKCNAELHNISTLRKHIAKLHKPEQEIINDHGYLCFWRKCSLLRKGDDGSLQPTPIPTEQEWLKHVDEEHIHPLGQKFGDGPSTQHIGKQAHKSFEAVVSKYFYNTSLYPTDARIVSYIDPQAVAYDRSSYLADSQGRITTHLAHSDDEPDAVILNDLQPDDVDKREAAQKAFNAFLGTHGHHKQDLRAAAEETLKAMKARKEKIGVGIDRGGCTLVNDEMRKAFAHNPGISKVVDYDY